MIQQINHAGTEMSLTISKNASGSSLTVEIKGNAKKIKISVGKGCRIDMFAPSVEGTVIFCILKDGSERWYDSATGAQLSRKELAVKKPTFYT